MLNEESLIKDFFEKTYEAYINEQMLEYEYSFPEEEIEDYVIAITSIPYKKFIDYVCEHYCPTPITSASIPQISSYDNCTTGIIRVLINNNDPGLDCKFIGKELFNDNIERNDGAYNKYGENHVKGAEFHGLTYCLYKKWFLTCLGRIYPSLDDEIKQYLFARTLLRNPFFHIVVSEAINHDVNIYNYMGDLSFATRQRRSSSCIHFFSIIIKQCQLENIPIFKIFYENPLRINTHNKIQINYKKLIASSNQKKSLSEECYQIPSQDDFPLSKSLNLFINELSKFHTYTSDEQADLFRLYHRGVRKTHDLIVINNLRLVLYHAYCLKDNGVNMEDLIQEGTFGLLKAIDSYNYSYNTDFTHYASVGIKNAIELTIKRMNNMIHVKKEMVSIHSNIQNKIERFELINGYKPSLLDIDLDIYNKRIENDDLLYLYQMTSNPNDIVTHINDWDSVEDDTFPVNKSLEREDLHSLVIWILSYLSLREQDILKRYYGIDCEREYSLEDIGKKHDLTRERVRQIKEKALNRLRGVFLKKKRTIYSLFGFYLGTKKGSYKNKNNNTSSTEYSNKDIRNNYLSAQNNATDNSPQYYILTTELNQTFIENGCRFPITSNKLIQLITNCDATENVTFNVPIQINEKKFYTQMRYCCFSNSDQNHFELDWKVQSHIQDILSELKNNHNYTVVEIYADKENRFIIKPVSRKK